MAEDLSKIYPPFFLEAPHQSGYNRVRCVALVEKRIPTLGPSDFEVALQSNRFRIDAIEIQSLYWRGF